MTDFEYHPETKASEDNPRTDASARITRDAR